MSVLSKREFSELTKSDFVERVVRSRQAILPARRLDLSVRKEAAEGGCGVIGMASSVPLPGRHLLRALRQMRNRGNGKGGGAALVGLDPDQFGVSQPILNEDYLLALAYLDDAARLEVEAEFIEASFDVDHVHEFPLAPVPDLPMPPPRAVAYFVRPKPEKLTAFAGEAGLILAPPPALEDEFVYQNSYRLNTAFYASLGEKRAFVLSHGKDMLALKMVGFGDDVIEAYQLHDLSAHVWIGHHRYPTKGRVWHPGGAHPFVGLHEALVHNGDFANYASVCAYLAQHNIHPLFLTDTEVSVLVFDLLQRTFGYPLEYVIESMAPTTERDFAMLPEDKRRVYRQLQATHMHASPDGPWFFLIAQSSGDGAAEARQSGLIGITDTSMLRPQVFALQEGEATVGFAASEKQAIDAALESLAANDDRFWPRADKYWNARGGSHTDGGAFVFRVHRQELSAPVLICTDKFGRRIEVRHESEPYRRGREYAPVSDSSVSVDWEGADSEVHFGAFCRQLADWSYGDLERYFAEVRRPPVGDSARGKAIELLSMIIDRRYPTWDLRRSSICSLADEALADVLRQMEEEPSPGFVVVEAGRTMPEARRADRVVVLDGRGFFPEGPHSLARAVVAAVEAGFRRVLVAHARGHRFLGNGLGADSQGVRLDVFGSSGDYLASGIDGAEIVMHGSGQDQLAQIMKAGRLVVHGDVGQTFMYAAKGGEAFVLGSAAGRPLINAVGKPRVVINGTCLDYLAESFMAGDPLAGGGFVVLNGVAFSEEGELRSLESPYPGGNLFSLASGGALFVRDPHKRLGEDQLNGGTFAPFEAHHWELIRPMLEENERLFGIPLRRLLEVDGVRRDPSEVYRAIVPRREKALMPEEAWVRHNGG